MAHEKIDKAPALYFSAAIIDQAGRASLVKSKGAACGRCPMFLIDLRQCTLVSPPDVDPLHGVCGMFSPGKPMPSSLTHKPMKVLPKAVAGYYEGSGTPTHCSNCINFEPTSHGEGTCKVVKGMVEEFGCCNFWEEKLALPQPPFIHSP